MAVGQRNPKFGLVGRNFVIHEAETLQITASDVAQHPERDVVGCRELSEHLDAVITYGNQDHTSSVKLIRHFLQLDQLLLAIWSPIGTTYHHYDGGPAEKFLMEVDDPSGLVGQDQIWKALTDRGPDIGRRVTHRSAPASFRRKLTRAKPALPPPPHGKAEFSAQDAAARTPHQRALPISPSGHGPLQGREMVVSDTFEAWKRQPP